MKWKAYFFLNPDAKGNQKETFGFNSRNTPPQIPAMTNFEKRLLSMIENIKFRKVKCWFQQKLSSDIQTNIKRTDELLIPADKTTNFYKMGTATYNDLLQKNITKAYKKVTPNTTNPIESEAKNIAQKLDLDDRINLTAKREAFITLKDHKPNFVNNPTCRLINPAKSEIGKISKQILDRMNTNVNKLRLNQWKNTQAVLSWFNSIENKETYSFIAFDVVDFYPSISIELLNAALEFASDYDNITADEKRIVLHAKKSLLYNSGEAWGKKASSNLFDVTIGSYDGAESCEVVGAFLLHKIKEKYGNNFGLYRDDGLAITRSLKMSATNFLTPAALFILAVTMYTGRLNHTLPQVKVIDFGLNTTFAAKDPPGIGFEAIIRTHREQRWRSAILKRDLLQVRSWCSHSCYLAVMSN